MKKSDEVKLTFDKIRISRSVDKRNWVLQELKEGGVFRKTGVKGEDKWVDVGYYGKLSHLILTLLDREIELPDGLLDTQLKSILEEIKKAEARLLEQMKVIE